MRAWTTGISSGSNPGTGPRCQASVGTVGMGPLYSRTLKRARYESGQLPTADSQFPTTTNSQPPIPKLDPENRWKLRIGNWEWLGLGRWELGIDALMWRFAAILRRPAKFACLIL